MRRESPRRSRLGRWKAGRGQSALRESASRHEEGPLADPLLGERIKLYVLARIVDVRVSQEPAGIRPVPTVRGRLEWCRQREDGSAARLPDASRHSAP